MPSRHLLCAALTLTLTAPWGRADDLFRRRVAPVLESRCLRCHDAKTKKGGLDLSTRAGLLAGGEEGAVVTPGRGGKSRLLHLVSGPKPRMPRSGEKLSDAEVALLRRWIDAGAPWPAGQTLTPRPAPAEETWWSLRPLARPAVPAVKGRAWVRTPIDAYILAALEAKGLRPSPEAPRATLIRRLSFDLTGLPPTPEQVRAFAADARPDAFERLVEGLLASPGYGERWGRHWLDVAHYGDTHGYDKDKRRDHAWPYRDWVIGALNADMPYRDFVTLQLAGDVLAPGAEGTAAAGFVVAGPWDLVGQLELREGTVDKEKTRLVDRDDMVSTAAGTFLSVTVGCARCHDHKFDPIPMRDYYRLQAVFAGVERGDRLLPDAGRDAHLARLRAESRALAARRAALGAEARKAMTPELARAEARLAGLRKRLAAVAPPAAAPSKTNGYHSGVVPVADATRWVQVDLGATAALDEVWLFPARPVDFPDTPGFGFPVRFKVEASEEPTFRAPVVLADHTRGDFANPGDNPVVVAARGSRGRHVRVTATRLWRRTNDHAFALGELVVMADGKNRSAGRPVTALDTIDGGLWARGHLVDGFDSRRRLPDLADAAAARAWRGRAGLQAALGEAEALRARLADAAVPPGLGKELAEVTARLASVEAALARPPEGARVYSVVSIPPRPIRVLKRGDVEQPGAVVRPGGLGCVGGPEADFFCDPRAGEGGRRLALAGWIADPRNVLTWRSIANRLWHHHFGRGIVDTPNDLGKMGGLPSHPALLDWLAAEVRDGASLKQMHRRIVHSATYRQACRPDAAAARLDADNRLLWRANRSRLDAESLRDAVLAVSGQLDRRMGGPGFELFRFKDDHSPVYDHDALDRIHDPATYRRTVYRFVVRSVPNPFLDCLDCADPNLPTPVRNTTLTALQALALRNNPFMARQARHFADRLAAEAPGLEGQVERAFWLLLGRPPGDAERAAVAGHARKHGLASACRVLWNANEFIFLD